MHDPKVTRLGFEVEMEAQGFPLDENSKVTFFGPDYKSAAHKSSCIVVLTEFDEFKTYPWADLCTTMQGPSPILFDFRSYLPPVPCF